MVRDFKRFLFSNNDKNYIDWVFPQSKSTMFIGLVATLIVTIGLSLEHYFYYFDDNDEHISISSWLAFPEIYIRIILFPILNTTAIILATSKWNNQFKKSQAIGVSVIIAAVLAIIIHYFIDEEYPAIDYAHELLPIIIIAQTLYGLSFKNNFYLSLGLISSTFILSITEGTISIEVVWTHIFIIVLWFSLLLGGIKLEQYRAQNFKNIFDLASANKKINEAHEKIKAQKHLLRSGEQVSQLCSFRISTKSNQITFSEGINAILNLPTDVKPSKSIFQILQSQLHPDDKTKASKQLADLTLGIVGAYEPYRILTSCGNIKWLKTVVQDIKEEEDSIYGTIQDISEEITLQHELLEQSRILKLKNETLQQFAYSSSHDLQEPLRTITNFVGILDKNIGEQLEGQNRTFLTLIKNSAHRMSNLILAILDYSRIGKNRNLTHLNCNEIIADVIKDLNYSIEKNNGKIIIENHLPSMMAYRPEFTMLFQNLIGNALKFRKKDIAPIITIRSHSDEKYHLFCVQDNGIGMEQKNTKKIFQLFSRLHNKDKYEGTGIGLTHCKKIVELHGGTIWVESVLDHGTSFHLKISKHLKIENNEKEFELHHAN